MLFKESVNAEIYTSISHEEKLEGMHSMESQKAYATSEFTVVT